MAVGKRLAITSRVAMREIISLAVVVAMVLLDAPPIMRDTVASDSVPVFGPRDAVGPDVPLSGAESAAFTQRVTVNGYSNVDIQSACDQAVREGVRVVFLPGSQRPYTFDGAVHVPDGLTLLGDGDRTWCLSKKADTMFFVQGSHVRFTRLKVQGASVQWSTTNNSQGVVVSKGKDVRVDHCELLGLSSGTLFSEDASGQVDHCHIHHCLEDGYGYGVAVLSGSCVLVCDNEFHDNRVSIASNGLAGHQKTHWEFLHNRVDGNSAVPAQSANLGQVDAHPGMDGSFAIEANVIENVPRGIYLNAGSGSIRGNLFSVLWMGIDVFSREAQGVTGMPHDIHIAENTFLQVDTPYEFGVAQNITIDGMGVPTPRVTPLSSSVGAGGSLQVTWSDLRDPTAKDWIGIFVPGSPSQNPLDWVYTNGQSVGTVTLPIATTREAGQYEVRLLRSDAYTLAATGGLISVTGPASLDTSSRHQ